MTELAKPAPIVVIAAFSVATVTAAAVGSALMMSISVMAAALVVAGLHSAILGVPCYLMLSRRLRPSAWAITATGYLIAALPIALLGLLGTPDFASVGGIPTIVNGTRTATGWFELLRFGLIAGIPGAVGGLAFWLVLKTCSASSATKGVRQKRGLPIAMIALASVLGVGLSQTPQLAIDRTCHNPLRSGGTSISSEVNLTLAIPMEDWIHLSSIVRDFAADHEWNLREDVRPDRDFPWFQVSACEETGTNIFLNKAFEGQIEVSVYQPQGGLSWRGPMADLVSRLNKAWPGKLALKDQDGAPAPPQAWYSDALEASPVRPPRPSPPPSPAPPS